MKKKYEKPIIEVIVIETEDVMNISSTLNINKPGDGEIYWPKEDDDWD